MESTDEKVFHNSVEINSEMSINWHNILTKIFLTMIYSYIIIRCIYAVFSEPNTLVQCLKDIDSLLSKNHDMTWFNLLYLKIKILHTLWSAILYVRKSVHRYFKEKKEWNQHHSPLKLTDLAKLYRYIWLIYQIQSSLL